MKNHNPLCAAVQTQDILYDFQSQMMFEIAGDAAFEPFDEALSEAVIDLIDRASTAGLHLSPRARHARFNLIWKDFVVEQKTKRAVHA
jgi:hypothetical protein